MTIRMEPDRFLIDKRGKATAVVLSIAHYRKILRLLDDQEDAQALKQAVRTSRGTLSHGKLLERLKR